MTFSFGHKAAWLLFGAFASQSQAARIQQHDLQEVTSPATYPVHILLTRHGLSCANIVGDFVNSMWKKSHALMKDPLLCEAGAHWTRVAHDHVQEALPKFGLPQPDAVLASVLVRAMHTALLQYPEKTPVYTVPFIRESGMGYDNMNDPIEDQKAKLKAALGDEVRVNFQYTYNDMLKDAGGDWTEFRNFLEKEFIPDLVRRTNKPSGTPIVLAIVSHSNFMNEGEIRAACKKHYDPNTRKARNNQVVKMSYTFTSTPRAAGDIQATPAYALKESGAACEKVTEGTSIFDASGHTMPLCRSDVGELCWKQITDEGKSSYPSLVEDTLKTMMDDIQKKKASAKKLREKTGKEADARSLENEIKILEGEYEKRRNKECWAGGKPQAPSR